MKKLMRYASIAIAAVLSVGMLAGCNSDEGDESGDQSGSIKNEAVASGDGAIYMTVDGAAVPGSLYEYYYNSYISSLSSGDSSYWYDDSGSLDEAKVEELKEQTEDQIRYIYAYKALADENGLTITNEEKEMFQTQLDSTKNQYDEYYGEEGVFESLLEETGLTEQEYIDYFMEGDWIYKKLLVDMYESEFSDSFDSYEFYHAKHILVMFEDADAEAHDAELEKANEIMGKIEDGEDFDALIVEHGEDPGMETYTDGYYFIEGDMYDEFYEATKALDEGEISEPVASTAGYHIIQRLPVEEEGLVHYLMLSEGIYNYATEDVQDGFIGAIENKMEQLTVAYDDGYDKLVSNIFGSLS